MSGSASSGGISYTAANAFTAAASGSVSRMDIGIGSVSGLDSFYAALYTDNNGLPGTQLGQWSNLTSNVPSGQCCGVVTISGISGLSLTMGQQYFLVLGPNKLADTSSLTWNGNSEGATGLSLYSTDGGNTWNSNGTQTLGAFDIVSQPVGIESNANLFTASASGSGFRDWIWASATLPGREFVYCFYCGRTINGVPGTQLAAWNNLTSATQYGECCGLVSITGITGLSLTAGQQYFMVLSPQTSNSSTSEQWNLNTTGATGLDLFSLDGGATWNSRGQLTLGAFDVIAAGDEGGRSAPQTTLFSNLGTEETVYQCCSGWPLTGGSGAPKSLNTGQNK